jgi:ATP-dependent RNA helicase DDX55/SPB4
MTVPPREKILQCIRLITHSLTQNLPKSIIYFPTCATVDYFFPLLCSLPRLATHKLISLHGQLPPSARVKNLRAFSETDSPCVLLTTDVAARGLDIPNVDLVVQVDAPQDPKNFAHRCGRAGRAGRVGRAVVLLSRGREEEYVDLLRVRGMPVEEVSRIDCRGEKADEEDSLGVDDLVKEFRELVLRDRVLHDKVTRLWGRG